MVGFQNNSVFDEAGQTQTGKSDLQESAGANPPCPQCSSKRIYRAGLRYLADSSSVQRWLCRDCGYRFSEKPSQENSKWSINTQSALTSRRQICALEAKNLDSATETKTVAGELSQTQQWARGKILEFAFWMQKQGYDEETVKNRPYMLRRLADLGADLAVSESVKETLALQIKWKESYKAIMVDAYSLFLKWQKLSWDPPRYKVETVMGYVPSNEKDLDDLIAAASKVKSAFLQGLKDTGADPGELAAIRDIDVNRQARTAAINYPVKGHNKRVLQVSNAFIEKISVLPRRKNGLVFNYNSVRENFFAQRKVIARKLANPNILKISFTTFRRWKGTMEYHRTKDLLHVQHLLGHKKIDNTLIYIDYEKAAFGDCENEAYVSRVALNTKEACELVDAGFEYVTGEYSDGGKIFRKLKRLFEAAEGNVYSGKTQSPSAR